MTNTPFTLQNAEILMWCYFIVNSIKIISINKLHMFFPFPLLWTLMFYILGNIFVSFTPIYYDMFSEIFIPFYHIALVILISVDILDIFPNNIELFEEENKINEELDKFSNNMDTKFEELSKIIKDPFEKSDNKYELLVKKSIADNKYYIHDYEE